VPEWSVSHLFSTAVQFYKNAFVQALSQFSVKYSQIQILARKKCYCLTIETHLYALRIEIKPAAQMRPLSNCTAVLKYVRNEKLEYCLGGVQSSSGEALGDVQFQWNSNLRIVTCISQTSRSA